LCGAALKDPDHCSRCDWVKGYRHRGLFEKNRPADYVAAALSIIPGAGHLYKGHTKAGVGFFFGLVIAIALLSALGIEGMGFQFLLLPVYWLWVMIQAFLIKDLRAVSPKPA
jgi:hypothetical protein